MNAERLHAVVSALMQETTDRDVVGKLGQLVTALQNVVNQSTASHQQNLANSLNDMYDTLRDAPSDSFSPVWRQVVSEIGGEDLFGTALRSAVEGSIARNQITPAVALKELQALHSRVKHFAEALSQCLAAFEDFKIGDEKLTPGECEVGVLIPRQAVGNGLIDFAKELQDLAFVLNTFSEVATGKKDTLTIRTLSSSDFMVHLLAAAPYAACVAVAIERVVGLYRQLLEIRRLHHDLQKQGIPEGRTAGVLEFANSLMEEGIEKLSVEIVGQFYTSKDAARRNELTNSVKISLSRIASRIDRGFNVEVRAEPLKGEPKEGSHEAAVNKSIAIIQRVSSAMQFLRLEGKPILKLTEAKKDTKKKGTP